METHQVRYFLTVARTLNFTKAAEECNVTQPSLTRAIKKLEDELGGPLFHRERANTHLTELGRATLPHIEQSYLAAQSARALAAAFKHGDVAPLRLGVTDSVSSRLFTGVLNGVRSGLPNFELAVEGGAEHEIRDAMLKGNTDLVILADNDGIPERMRAWPLFRENFRLVMPTSHPLAGKPTLMLSDLDGEDIIERARCSGCQRLRQLCAANGVTPRFRHRVDSVEQLFNLVRAGFGIGFTTRSSRLTEGLVGRPIDQVEVTREVSLATVAGRRFSAATDAFVKLARMRDWTQDLAAVDRAGIEV
jgi:LysR family transcriptional regulator, hydrogen peroxide-inducible genes activator